jgi:hypothetical protein
MAQNIYQTQVRNPFMESIQGYATGFKTGAEIRGIQEQRMAAQQAAERQEALNTRIQRLAQNPTPQWQDYEEVMMFMPKDQAEQFRKNFEARTTAQQDSAKKFTGQVTAALSSQNKESNQRGIDLLLQRAQAERDAGNEDEAKAYELHATIAQTNPKAVADELMIIGSSTFGKDWGEGIIKVREAPERFDMAKEEVKIKKIEADLKREKNVIEKQKLEADLTKARTEFDDKVRKQTADANTAFANFDNFLNTADRALAGWGRTKDGKVDITKPKGYVESATGPISTRLPTLSQDTADFEEIIEVLKGQAFLAQVEKMKGLGALSDKEGDALRASLTNLSLRQSPEQLGRNLLEAQRLILKARNEVARKYNLSAEPDRPAGPGGAAPAEVPSAMGQATDRAVTPGMPTGFRVLGRE